MSMPLEGLNTLLVEDSQTQIEYMRYTLESAGLHVSTACNGREAIDMLQSSTIPDLVMSDIVMPEIDGYDLCREIRESSTMRHVPVVLLTVLSDPGDVVRALECGADGFLVKPFDLEGFRSCLEQIPIGRKSQELLDSAAVPEDAALAITFNDESRIINTTHRQTLGLLLSTYSNAVRQNARLAATELELRSLTASLEDKVIERTNELLAKEKSYRAILENTFSGFYRHSLSGGFLEVNDAFVRMLGYPNAKEMYATGSLEQLYASKEAYRAFRDQCRSCDGIEGRISHLKKKDGTDAIVIENVRVVRDQSGDIEHVEGLVHDVTSTVKTESYLRLSNELAHLLNCRLDTQSILSMVVDRLIAAGAASRVAVVLPDSTNEMFEVSAQCGGVQHANAARLNKTFLAAGSRFAYCMSQLEIVYNSNLEERNPDDESSLIDSGIRSELLIPICEDKEPIGVLAVGRDRTDAFETTDIEFMRRVADHLGVAMQKARLYSELKTAYETLQQTQAQVIQQERLRAVGQMASGIAHDFNNALSSILGFADLLLVRPNILEDPLQTREYIKYIHESATDATSIVKRLREVYRKPEDNGGFRSVDISALAERAIEITEPIWGSEGRGKGLNIEVTSKLERTPPVRCDPSAIREVITNLIINGVDAIAAKANAVADQADTETPSWEKVEQIEIKSSIQSDEVILSVRDTGHGMPEDVKAQCLEPFFSTKGEHGTGLGLAMVANTLQRHSARLDIESKPGYGTTFSISFAVDDSSADNLQHKANAPDLKEGLHVLLVDDVLLAREAIKEYLKISRAVVVTASSGAEALEKLDEGYFDLVITDKGMPGMPGDELAKRIKQLRPNLPIILMTGFGAFMKARGEQPEGVDLIVSKPVSYNDLMIVIARVMDAASERERKTPSEERSTDSSRLDTPNA